MKLEHKKLGDVCPKCKTLLESRERQFYWRGKYFPGLVCSSCNGLWEVEGNNIFDEAVKPLRK